MTVQRLTGALVRVAVLAVILCSLLAIPTSSDPRRPHLVAGVLPQANPMSLQIVNTADRSWKYRWAARLNVITDSTTPTLLNTLDLASTCGDCKTVGISVQFNIVQRSAGTVVSRSDATSQLTCTFGTCVTMGLVVQYTVIVDNPSRVLRKVQRLMARSVALMRRMFPNHRVGVTRVLAGFNALARLLVPHAPRIVLTTAPSSSSTDTPGGPPTIVVALVS